MTTTIIDKVVFGGPAYKVPAHLNFGQYVIDKLQNHSTNADAIAVINGDTDEKTSYSQLLQYIVSIATGLKKTLKVKRGDIVGVCGERRIEYIVSLIAAMCCGATVTVFDERSTPSEIMHVLNISRPSILICSKSVLEQHLGTFKPLKFVKKIVQMQEESIDTSIYSFTQLNIPTNVKEFEITEVEGCTDGLFILYSSGTTGMPKGAVLSHLTVLYAAATLDNDQTKDEYNKNLATIYTIVPWHHAYGLITIILSIVLNRPMIYSSSFDIRNYLLVIERYKPNVLSVVPSMIDAFAKASIIKKFDVSSVFELWSTSAPLSPSTAKEAVAKFPNCSGVFNGYGMTETLAPMKNTGKQAPAGKLNTVGYPSPGIKIKIVDVETETKLGINQKGEIRIKGPLVMKGYANNEKATKEAFDKEGYLKTGDIGYYDEDGCFYIVDRLKHLIKYKGFQVSPTEVERVLLQHPQVAECGVVGTPDEFAGELPTAFVVVKDGETVTEKDLLAFSNSRLSENKRIRGGIIFVDKIPKTAIGKISHNVLKIMARQKRKSKL